MGKAVISTTVGAEGLPVRSEQDILIADTPEEFAKAAVRLLGDPNLRGVLGRAARELVVQKHSWASVAQHFEATLEALLSPDRMLVGNVRH